MKTWEALNVEDTLWLINSNGELLSTKIYQKEIGSYAGNDAYGYTFNLNEESGYNAYKLIITIGYNHEDVLHKQLSLVDSRKVMEGYKVNTDLYFISSDKIKLIEAYIAYEQKNIVQLNEDIDHMHKELMRKYKQVDIYKELINNKNDSI